MTKTLTIKTTQITWRQIMGTTYVLMVIADGVQEWTKHYDNSIDAVNASNAFILLSTD